PFHFQPPNYVNAIAPFTYTNVVIQVISNVVTTNITVADYVMIGGSFTQVGGNFALHVVDTVPWVLPGFGVTGWNRADKRPRYNVARLIGGYTPGPGNIEFVNDRNTIDEHAGTLTVPFRRIDGRLGTVGGVVSTVDNLATNGSDFTAS